MEQQKTRAGLKAIFWIALAMLMHYLALVVGKTVTVAVFRAQDFANGILRYENAAEKTGLLYQGIPAAESEAYAARYLYGTTGYATLIAVPLVLLGIWLLCKAQKEPVKETLPWKSAPNVQNFLAFIIGFTVYVPVACIMIYSFLRYLAPETGETINIMYAQTPYWLLVCSTAVGAPLIEELTFRGFIYSKLQKPIYAWMLQVKEEMAEEDQAFFAKEAPGLYPLYEVHLRKKLLRRSHIFTIVLQGLLFGAFHLNLQQFIYASAMGMLFGLMRYHTGSIWPGVFAHIGFNSFSVILNGLGRMQDQWAFAKQIAHATDGVLLVATFPVFVIALLLFEKLGKNGRKTVDHF